MLHYYQAVLGDDLPDPKGPLTIPMRILWQVATESSKQVHAAAIGMVALTQRPVCEQASTLARTISSRCQVWIEGNQASSEPLSLVCTAQKIFHANISAARVTASSTKFIARETFYIYDMCECRGGGRGCTVLMAVYIITFIMTLPDLELDLDIINFHIFVPDVNTYK